MKKRCQRGYGRLTGAMARPEKGLAAWDTGLSDFDIMTLGLILVIGRDLEGLLERTDNRE